MFAVKAASILRGALSRYLVKSSIITISTLLIRREHGHDNDVMSVRRASEGTSKVGTYGEAWHSVLSFDGEIRRAGVERFWPRWTALGPST